MGFSRLGWRLAALLVISVVAGCLTWANGAPARASVDDAGNYWHLHFLALGWQFSQKRAARRLLERDPDLILPPDSSILKVN